MSTGNVFLIIVSSLSVRMLLFAWCLAEAELLIVSRVRNVQLTVCLLALWWRGKTKNPTPKGMGDPSAVIAPRLLRQVSLPG